MTDAPPTAIIAETPPSTVDARLSTRMAFEFVLRTLVTAADANGGEIVPTVILMCIVAANTSHLNDRHGASAKFRDLEDLPQDADRRPISVLALSKSLGMPFETTRRHVNALIARGACVRVPGGVIAPTALITSAPNMRVALVVAASARRFARDLKRAGVRFD